jgi:D-lactate dehydrogenase
MPDVFFYETYEEEAALLPRLMPPHITAGYTDKTIQESGHAEPGARFISTRTQSKYPLEWAPKLDVILSRSTGFDHLAAYAAATTGYPIQFGNLPLYCPRAVAEHALMLWLALLRRLPRQMRQFPTFFRDGLTGYETQNRTLAVVGVGNIGREICVIGRGLGMKVLGVDRDPRHAEVDYASIDEALAAADVVACAMDFNATNRGYFDADKWRHVKPGAVFVNVSRGELSPSTALLAALESGRLAGVGLDVFDHEPELAVTLRSGGASDDAEVRATIALAARDDVICTPHNAFNSEEALERKSLHSVQQIEAYFSTGRLLWPALPAR